MTGIKRPVSAGRWLAALLALTVVLPVLAAEGGDKVLRVCADPNNLPLSNRKEEGYENKIAELLAKDLGWKLEYTWFPQRMGFIRNTLRARDAADERYKCDLVMGVPVGFELAATTRPYYRSTYALAYVKGRGLDGVKTPDDLLKLPPETLSKLKFGVFGQTPPVDWLLRNKLFDQAIPYQIQTGDPQQYPGEIIQKDLTAGTIDVAFAWGPIAGYFAKMASAGNIVVVPFRPEPEIKFDYSIAMGVRYGEKEWKETVQKTVDHNLPAIQGILASYGVPLVDDQDKIVRVSADSALVIAPPPPPYKVTDGRVDMGTYAGWRIFQNNCAKCHGAGAEGTQLAPNLLPIVKDMSSTRFVGTVLRRYSQITPAGELYAAGGTREALIDEILSRKQGDVPMPAWDGDPNVKPHILDLYSYLRARSDGVLGDGKPEVRKP